MSLQDFLARCSEFEAAGNPADGLLFCDQLLTTGVRRLFRAQVLRYKAVFLLMSGDGSLREAAGILKQALDIVRNSPLDQPGILNLLIATYANVASPEFALEYVRQFFDLLAANDDERIRKWTPKILFNLAYCYDTGGDFALAAETYEQALTAAEPNGFNPGYAEHNLVQVYLELGRVEEALAMLDRSRTHLDLAAWGAHTKDQEAQCLLAIGRYAEAAQACQGALAHPACTDRVKAETMLTLARVEQAQGRLDRAGEIAQAALEIATRLPCVRIVNRITRFQRTL